MLLKIARSSFLIDSTLCIYIIRCINFKWIIFILFEIKKKKKKNPIPSMFGLPSAQFQFINAAMMYKSNNQPTRLWEEIILYFEMNGILNHFLLFCPLKQTFVPCDFILNSILKEHIILTC
jgi:hypothetical protein